jgi:hypothetical protein
MKQNRQNWLAIKSATGKLVPPYAFWRWSESTAANGYRERQLHPGRPGQISLTGFAVRFWGHMLYSF